MANISSPHDSFFRSVLADSQMALDYFKSALPEHVIQLLDLATLTRVPDSYVSGELEKTMSDVVYTCQRVDGKGSVAVSLLLEHKSSPDKYTPVQMGGYLFSGYQQQIKQGQKQLTPSYPSYFTMVSRNGNTAHWIGYSMIWVMDCLNLSRIFRMFTTVSGIYRKRLLER